MTRTILIADDHPLFRQALAMAAGNVAKDARLVEGATLASALREAQAADDLALILLDLKMPGAEGFSGVALLHAEKPEVPILVVSSEAAAGTAQNALRFGAVGFIGKDSDLSVIEAAIADALIGKRLAAPVDPLLDPVAAQIASLTPTQLKVMLGVMQGRLNKQIAFDLGLSEATIKAHMTSILKKLDVQNRTQAVLVAKALGLAPA
ncbi:response regulator [Aquidulcibacter sp.]|jgi:DNA-binding NarL/FixJ family response regulator|uniref:response regulator transcription factor n=1 Tax=Aquidulcibacter sp. TaxID=2052990 RepID=UPI00078EAB53|nr:LuxR family transcriptional regulator [Hyphomonadaceae bacterium UKL13-1]OYU53116.1 MAG: LuxR family transcriptional regulator [Alphaproteobacteria bacterium PA1]HCP65175.1 LuxR family transcriptional regulator [Hyphomonadaceae bacterium]